MVIVDGIINTRQMIGVCLALQNGGIVQKCISIGYVFMGLNYDFKLNGSMFLSITANGLRYHQCRMCKVLST